MKLSRYHFLSFLLPAALGAQTVVPVDPNCCGNTPEGELLVIRDAASAAEVNAKRQRGQQAYERSSISTPTEKVEIRASREGFLAGSEFLVGAYGFAILPKGSSVVKTKRITIAAEPPKGDIPLLSWTEFVARHRGVVRSIPVTEGALSGEPASLKHLRSTIKTLQSAGMTCVTTLQGNPISVPLPTEEVAAK